MAELDVASRISSELHFVWSTLKEILTNPFFSVSCVFCFLLNQVKTDVATLCWPTTVILSDLHSSCVSHGDADAGGKQPPLVSKKSCPRLLGDDSWGITSATKPWRVVFELHCRDQTCLKLQIKAASAWKVLCVFRKQEIECFSGLISGEIVPRKHETTETTRYFLGFCPQI
jgi:hypothetical protein